MPSVPRRTRPARRPIRRSSSSAAGWACAAAAPLAAAGARLRRPRAARLAGHAARARCSTSLERRDAVALVATGAAHCGRARDRAASAARPALRATSGGAPRSASRTSRRPGPGSPSRSSTPVSTCRTPSSPGARTPRRSTRRSPPRSAASTAPPSHRSSERPPTARESSASTRKPSCGRGTPLAAQGTRLETVEIVNGILEASRRGRGVINLSLGGTERDPLIEQAVAQAVARGSLVVAASGNDGQAGSPLGYPAVLPHVLTVAATNRSDQVASFSSRSAYVDLAAPGAGITVATTRGGGWQASSGTSFSAPLVSGAAAWVWTARPELDWSQVSEVLRRSASDLGAPGRDRESGFGHAGRARRPRSAGADPRPAGAERRRRSRRPGGDRLGRPAPAHRARATHGAPRRPPRRARGPARRLPGVAAPQSHARRQRRQPARARTSTSRSGGRARRRP